MSRRDRKCEKRRYTDKATAEAAVRTMQTRTDLPKVPKSAYYCKKCRGFHITSITQDEYRERMRRR